MSDYSVDPNFQAVGIIAAVGDAVKGLEVGMPAALMTFGSYSEFMMVTKFIPYVSLMNWSLLVTHKSMYIMVLITLDGSRFLQNTSYL